MAINKVIISGNLTRDPEKRGTSDSPIIGFGIASNSRKKQGNEWVDVPNFVDVSVFGARAKALGEILTKGMKVCIEGELRYSQWEKDGVKRSKLEIIAHEIEIMTAKSDKPSDSTPW